MKKTNSISSLMACGIATLPVVAALFLESILLNKFCVQNESLKSMHQSSVSDCHSIKACATAIVIDWETPPPRERAT